MTAPIVEEDVEAPLRLQPVLARPDGWRGRSITLLAVGLVGFIVVGIVLGTATRDGPAPSSPAAVAAASVASAAGSPRSTPSPRPTPIRLASPLPTMEILGGPLPTEHRLVYANGLQILDLATGALVTPGRPDDFLLPIPGNQLVCACIVRPADSNGAVAGVGVRFGRLDLAGTRVLERDLPAFDGIVPVPEMTDGFSVLAAVDAQGRTLFVLDLLRRPPVWTVELRTVDIETGNQVGMTRIDRLPVDFPGASPAPATHTPGTMTDGIYAWANSLTVAPDGRTVFVSVNASQVRDSVWTNDMREWMVPIRNGRPRTALALSAGARLGPDSWCVGRPTFVDPTLLVRVCNRGAGQSPIGDSVVQRLTTAGASLDDLPIGAGLGGTDQPATAVIDPRQDAVFIWNPQLHAIGRIGIGDGQASSAKVPDSLLPKGRSSANGGYPGADPGLVISPDGRRLYALGIGPGAEQAGISTGVWVFDPDTLEVLDHWAPRAYLTSIAVSADGRFVYAAGASGFDVDGHLNRWPASVTVYDALSGDVRVIYGAVAQDTWISFPPGP